MYGQDVRAELAQRHDDGVALQHRDAQPPLRLGQCLTEMLDDVRLPLLVALQQHCSDCHGARVSVHFKRPGWFGEFEHGPLADGVFELAECLLLRVGPYELCVFGEQVVEWLGDAAKVLDEVTVKPCQAQHAAHFAFVFWRSHFLDGFDFCWVWLLRVLADDVTQVLCLFLAEAAFADFGLQVVLFHAPEHFPQQREVLFPRLAVHQDVVDKDHDTTA